ncbi:hypothetical protein QDW38_gp64 [Microbacterium phage Lynlen]|uniref:hypothetical protein n=1 Tax=Microbacterium phage Lynlen TaxID=2725651 RepID=UPI001462CE8A|nr:hypothetical protein QDW38_gp64 [Microbacterium phage Lynlen]QJD53473.1 hypothetical protein SEA_LYNLEN_64 [Microbacterium phage Lynlen]
MSRDFRDLKVGDEVKLTGPDWGVNVDRSVRVERLERRQAFNDSVVGVGSLTDSEGFSYGEDYAIERVTTESAQPTAQGYTLSLYVSKTAAAEFPGETQELASITINHDDLASLLSQGRGILDVVADG